MGPPWCGQGIVPHTTLSDLLSTDVPVSPPGALVGAGEETYSSCILSSDITGVCCSADAVLMKSVIVLLVLLPNTAVTLTVQLLLPALIEEMVCVVAAPLTASDDVCCESQKFRQEYETL